MLGRLGGACVESAPRLDGGGGDSMSRFRASKFRHAEAKVARKQDWVGGLQSSCPSGSPHIKANTLWVAFSTEAAGVLGAVPLGSPTGTRRGISHLRCHSDVVTDLDFSPFDKQLLATGSADGVVKVWRLLEPGQDLSSSPHVVLGPEGGPVQALVFHPTADGVLASAAGKAVKIWDVEQQQILTELDPLVTWVQSLAWKPDGSLLGASCQDRRLHIFDPRAKSVACQTLLAHAGGRETHLLWVNADGCFLSVGSNQVMEREVSLWDSRQLGSPLTSLTLDASPRPLIPLFEPGSGLLVLAGKGETGLFCYEVQPAQPAVAHGHAGVPERLVPGLSRKRPGGLCSGLVGWGQHAGEEGQPGPCPQAHQGLPLGLPASPAPALCPHGPGRGPGQGSGPQRPASAFRHIEGVVLPRTTHFTNLRSLSLTTPGECDGFCANRHRVAIPLLAAGGQVAILELSQPGRLPDTPLPTIQNGPPISDLCWDPFDEQRLAIAGEDTKIRLWRVEPTGLQRQLLEPEVVLRGHTEKIYSIKFHPLASDVLASSSYDKSVRIWDARTGRQELRLHGHTDQIFSLAWSPNGGQLATVSKDGKARVYEPRQAAQPLQEGPGPKGGRGARVTWVCGSKYLLVSGFDSRSERQLSLHQAEALAAGPLATLGLDISPSTLIPFYDMDTSVAFFTGKGDTRVFVYEVVPEAPFFLECNSFISCDPHKGFHFLAKTACDVREVEVARALRLRQTSIEPVAFRVPRVKKEFFQDDLFPATRVWWEPALSATAWLKGANTQQQSISLQPKDMRAVSQAPKEAPSRKYLPSSVYLEEKSDQQKKEELLSAMVAKLGNRDDPLPQDSFEGVDEEEWD
ncbi:coronin-7-like isoform X2 [Erythrolamprus reginae]|uniref:coronin-7-like isoform X2 n=1 Tax=Erythrolamprus reginae TaxID=121349 RepID=UPI00396C87DE